MITRRGALLGALFTPIILRHPSFGRLVPITRPPTLVTVYIDVGQWPTYEEIFAKTCDDLRESFGSDVDLSIGSNMRVVAELTAQINYDAFKAMRSIMTASAAPIPHSDRGWPMLTDEARRQGIIA